MADLDKTHGEPYCASCGYILTGAVDSSKCPECGRPLVDVLMRPSLEVEGGKRFQSKARIFGMPVVDVAFGASGREKIGRPRGFIAIGDVATGVLAIGGQARGVIAIGGFAMGGFTLGGMSLGLFSAMGGMVLGGFSFGGWAMGAIARGGGAIGFVSDGGFSLGYFARGGGVIGAHTIGPRGGGSAVAQSVFDSLHWYFGPWPPSPMSYLTTACGMLAVTLGLAAIVGLVAIRAAAKQTGESETA